MPCDVAVNQPGAWVVGAHGDGDIALVGEQDDVTSGRIVEVEVCEACPLSVRNPHMTLFDVHERGSSF